MSIQRRSRPLTAFARFARFLAAGAFLSAVGTAPAFANAGMGVQVIFPPSVSVGQTGLTGTIDIQNTSTPDTLKITLNSITLIPSCGAYSVITCTAVDPGVLLINTPAVGRALTACAGVSFTTAPTGQLDGSYSFTPVGTVVLDTPGSANDRCVIDFTFNVLKSPTVDASPGIPGVQTLPGAVVTGTANDTSQAVGFGTAFFVTVDKANPAIVTSASSAVVAGGSINDIATLSLATNPTGTITFRLYGPNNANCTGAPIFTSVVAVNGNGPYPSGFSVASAAGTYRWIAAYSGDANNNAVAGACNDANESVIVTPGTPSLTTKASAAIKLGGNVTDTATLLSGIAPTGSITFRLYGPNVANVCNAGNLVFTSSAVAVNGNGNYTSTPTYAPTAIGTYRWIASYSGDANNNAITGTCGDANESVVVSQATPTIVTAASPNVVIGGSVTDSATIASGVAPTGNIVFRLYGPSASVSCAAGLLVFTSAPIAVNGNGSYGPSGSFTPTVPGTYRWIASYSGDTNNAAIAGSCGATGETVMITKASPTLATVASAGGALGISVTDSATLSGGFSLTGTLVFKLYGPSATNTCTDGAGGNLVFTSAPITVNGAGSYGPSGSFTPTVAGTYRWRATYSGDTNNNGRTGACDATNESVTIAKLTPTIATTASTGGAIGTQLTDTAVVSGGSAPTGTVTFNLYGPNNASCSGNAIFTSTNALVAGSATSNAYTTLAAGVYRWTATYSGDANNNGVSHPCNSANESATITQATPTIATVASAGGAVGKQVSDTASVTGSSPTGSVTFNLYGPDNAACSGSPIFTSTIALAGGSATSASYTTTAPGVYRWTASYSGDANNAAVSHPCNSANESATITKASPTIATVASAGGAIGTLLSDTATLTGAVNPTGTVTFSLYGPDNATCSGSPVFTSTVNLSGASATSASYTTTAAGVYRWTATYNGDTNNNAVSHPCNAANESATIAKSSPTIATVASAGGPIGTQLTDTATVSGGSNPTGTVTFNLYGPNDATCTGTPVFTSATVPLTAGSATSAAFTTTLAGVYRWRATYNGDANNNVVAHPCNAANESATIGTSTPTIVTVASAGGPIGTQLTDTATVSGGSNPTGTVTFNLYGPNDATCTGTPVFTSATVPLTAGSATSAAFTTTLAGVYRWTATYNGDANNNAVSHPCNSANESATIAQTTPTLVTQATALVILGASITDTATLSGATNPTGTITFRLYGPNDATCANPPLFTSNAVAVDGNGSYPSTPSFKPLLAATYRWIASYSGDANNAALSGACNDANENVTVTSPAPPPSGPPRPVPTLSQWALLLLVLMMGMVAMANVRGRRR
ncbi:MAG: IPTL-CTERM sorting domain-containing protein [Betaproteobacteria bacterium]